MGKTKILAGTARGKYTHLCLGCLKKNFLPGPWQATSKLLDQRLQPHVPYAPEVECPIQTQCPRVQYRAMGLRDSPQEESAACWQSGDQVGKNALSGTPNKNLHLPLGSAL